MFLTALGWLMLEVNRDFQMYQQKTMPDAHFVSKNVILVAEACQI